MSAVSQVIRRAGDVIVVGTTVTAFIHNGGRYYLWPIKVYQDGIIDCWDLVDFAGFQRKVAEDWVVATPPEGAEVSVDDIARFTIKDVSGIGQEDLVGAVADELERLNGRPTSLDRCKQAFHQFRREPTAQNLEAVRQAYAAVPTHLRRYLGDMDTKDVAFRMVIYGEEELETWSHRVAARAMGIEPLPSIDLSPPPGSAESTP